MLFRSEVGSERLKYHALVDLGAHLNVLSWNVYTKLKKSNIQQQQRMITGFNGSTSMSPGYVELQLYIQGMPLLQGNSYDYGCGIEQNR